MPSYRILPANTLRRTIIKPTIMPCYVAAPRAPRQSYHAGFGPFFGGGRAVSPFADLTSTLQPFFRLLDEELGNTATSQPLRRFQPRFDVREADDAFHLQGELPGIDQKNITIEFKDDNTLVISGRTERSSQTGNDPATGAPAADTTSAEGTNDAASETGSSYKQPSVEDEFVDVAGENEKAQATPESSVTETGKEAEKPAEPKAKYWVSERSVGEFSRSFTFPGHVNQEAVTASLKNGVLSVLVPKALQKAPRRINVE